MAGIVTLFYASMYFATGSSPGVRNVYYALAVAPFIFLLAWRPSTWTPLASSPIFLLVCALIAWTALSTLLTLHNGGTEAIWDAIRYSLIILTFFAIVTHASTRLPRFPYWFFSLISISGGIAGLYFSLSHIQSTDGFQLGSRLSLDIAFAGNPNRVATLFAPPSIIAFALALSSSQWKSRVIFFSCFLAALGPVVFSQARTIWIAIFFALAAILFWHQKKKALIALALFIIVALGAIFNIDTGGRDLTESRNIEARADIYKSTWDDITQAPLLGYGMLAPQDIERTLRDRDSSHAHNTYLSFWRQGGAPGLLLLIAILGYASWYAWKRRDLQSENADALSCIFGLLVLYAITSLAYTRWPLASPSAVWLMFWVPLGMAVAHQVVTKKTANPPRGDHNDPHKQL
ncbi:MULTISPECIES: O-antigen ligase [Halorhodospira]|uniref:O-antigen ligase family protein n=1 Tax=Halorhodospira TaxID=85108 RepID=UPI001EE8C67D|nr:MULTISPECIES: O-antigen ligase family protein [Halorhodospira]MCG5528867.1 O-antigen ligase family protein [Halorhodospira halophila]MCG5544253.1 O-antigen ligase family protein [Halorhodospira sp. 9628]